MPDDALAAPLASAGRDIHSNNTNERRAGGRGLSRAGGKDRWMRGNSGRSQNALKREQAQLSEGVQAQLRKKARRTNQPERGQADGGGREGNEARACRVHKRAGVSDRRLCAASFPCLRQGAEGMGDFGWKEGRAEQSRARQGQRRGRQLARGKSDGGLRE